jgi:hypothetical protein
MSRSSETNTRGGTNTPGPWTRGTRTSGGIFHSPLSSLGRNFSTKSNQAKANAAESAACFTALSPVVFSSSRSSFRITCSRARMFCNLALSSLLIVRKVDHRGLRSAASVHSFPVNSFHPITTPGPQSVRARRKRRLQPLPPIQR